MSVSGRSPCRDIEVYAQSFAVVSTLGWNCPDLNRISKHSKIKRPGWRAGVFSTYLARISLLAFQRDAFFFVEQRGHCLPSFCCTKSVQWNWVAACLISTFTSLLSLPPSLDPLCFDPATVTIKKSTWAAHRTQSICVSETQRLRERDFFIHSGSFLRRKNPYKTLF